MALANGTLEGVVPLFTVAGSSGARLRFGSAYRWGQIRNGVHAKFGWWPEVTSAGDGYRTLARQVELFERNYTTATTGYGPPKGWRGDLWWRRSAGTPSAAVPGTSNHGLGKTVDVYNLGGVGVFTTTRYRQFAEIAEALGFSNAEGRSIGEPWHWSDTEDPDVAVAGAPGAAPTQEDEDDMTPQQEAAFNAMYSWMQEMHPRILIDLPAAKANTETIKDTLGTPDAGALHRILAAAEQVNAKADNIARGVATLLSAPGGVVGSVSDADLARIAKAVNDEQHRRSES